MINKKIIFYIFTMIFFVSINPLSSDSEISNPLLIKGSKFNVSIEFYNFPLKLGEQFFDVEILNISEDKNFKGNADFYFNTPGKNKRYKVVALKLPAPDLIYKSAFTFKQSGIWNVELILREGNDYEEFYFKMNIQDPNLGTFKYGYLLMLFVPLLILIGIISLYRESRKNTDK